jgi:mannitol/fructose-specific phosphotransferase system IIA component (Ntr-type)
MKISDIITINSIEIKDNLDNKFFLIKNLIDLAGKSGSIKDFEGAYNDVVDREKIMSTGVGKSIALPHAKTEHINNSTGSLILLQEPIEYDSLDEEPIRLAILLLSKTTNISLHLKMLSQISRLLNNDSMRNRILECNSPNEIYEQIIEFETNTFKSEKKEYLFDSSNN